MSDTPDREPDMVFYECQFCDAFHDSREEHEEHVERMHYAELLRKSDPVGEERDNDDG